MGHTDITTTKKYYYYNDKTETEAIQQIKDRKYALRFSRKIGEEPRYTGRILAVGIAYEKESKKHSCIVEVL